MFFGSRSQTRFALLPPSQFATPAVFRNIEVSHRRHHQLLAGMQRFRGRVYHADGAVRRSELTADGRHKLKIDARSWHVLSIDRQGEIVACLRYLEESEASGFDSLGVRHAAVARCPRQGQSFRRAVEREMAQARRLGIGFGEVGGWAVRQDHRGTMESLRIVLATYALLELLGSSLGVATATFRHGSESILRRIGLHTLTDHRQEIAPYVDPQYDCLMQVLRYDSRYPNPKYHDWIIALMSELADAPVICHHNLRGVLGRMWRGMDVGDLAPAPVSVGG